MPVVAAGNDGVELVADGADDVVHVLVPPLASTSPHTLAAGLPTPTSLGHLPGVLVHLAVVDGLAKRPLPRDLDDVIRGGYH